MPFTTGSATDHVDLLEKLRVFAVSTLGWTELYNVPAGSLTGTGRLALRGPGAGDGRRVFINFITYGDVTNSLYGWSLRGSVDWVAAHQLNPENQLGSSPRPFLNLWQNAMTYWFYGNDRRIIIVVKVGAIYVSSYMGFFLPWGLPAQYPFPLLIAGDYSAQVAQGNANSGRRFFIDPGGSSTPESSAWYRTPAGIWRWGANHGFGANVNSPSGSTSGNGHFKVWPHNVGSVATSATNQYQWGTDEGLISTGLDRMVASRQNERPAFPTMILDPAEGIPGTLDGAYAIPGAGLAAEAALAVGGLNLRLFQNLNRSSGNDFMGIVEA